MKPHSMLQVILFTKVQNRVWRVLTGMVCNMIHRGHLWTARQPDGTAPGLLATLRALPSAAGVHVRLCAYSLFLPRQASGP